jgi:hypothetical protein
MTRCKTCHRGHQTSRFNYGIYAEESGGGGSIFIPRREEDAYIPGYGSPVAERGNHGTLERLQLCTGLDSQD